MLFQRFEAIAIQLVWSGTELVKGDLTKQRPGKGRAGRVLVGVKPLFWNRACVIR